ncbi:hypothetical protein NBRC3222_2009 [Acetobacter pasteurianus NBRC 3222]|nr:hypothetical protein NBRC3222_2009 [Acetobacter pasteurianus NBRC 3222]
MIVIVRGDGFIVENRYTIHQHTSWHKFAIKEQAMFWRNQHVLVRHACSNSIFQDTDRVTCFIISQIWAYCTMCLSSPCYFAGDLLPIHICNNLITHANIFNIHIAMRCSNHAACKEADFINKITICICNKIITKACYTNNVQLNGRAIFECKRNMVIIWIRNIGYICSLNTGQGNAIRLSS